jgi:23S rRNA (uridine2552-2'-O)-methyltransferase|tara:strand:- start:388 stop:966 length:579 start_codon:yes stop_codon:yes gene_type:complete
LKDIQDTWAKKAKNEGYRSRASYKLIQINQTHNLIEQADLIIELGSAPGGWSQVISNKKKTHTKCLAIDILSMEKINSIDFYKIDLYSDEFAELSENLTKKPDLILSDMSVNLSGIKLVDDEANLELNLFCLNLSKKILNKDGALLIKTFSNQNLKKIKKLFEENFKKVVVEKPPASKTSSAEVYLLGLVPK